jgi:hypothetical protein
MRNILIALCIACLGALSCTTLNLLSSLSEPTPEPTEVPVVAASPTRIAATAATPTKPGSPPVPPTEKPTSAPTSAPVPAPKSLQMKSPEYGAQAFLWWRPETADRDLGLMKEIGMTWVKQQFAWRDIEGSKKGAFNWENADRAVKLANSKGIDILARMDNAPDWAAPGCFNTQKKSMGPAKNTQDWLDFLGAFVARYKGRIRAYEIWNEPNLAREWCNRPPNAAEYVALLKASYAKIKSIDPNAMVVSAGLTPTTRNDNEATPDTIYIEKMYAAMNNNSTGYFDALGVHAPGYKAPPEMSPDDVGKNREYNNGDGPAGRIYCFRHVEDIRKIMVARGDSAKQIVLLEFGWTMDPIHPAYSWFRVDEQTHASYIVGAYQYAKKNWAPWIGAMFVIYMANPDWTKDNEEYWWAITQPNGDPRAAWVRLKAMPK